MGPSIRLDMTRSSLNQLFSSLLLNGVDDDYGKLDNTSGDPTPDNYWSFGDLDCDATCIGWTTIAVLLLGTHLTFMLGPLAAWA